MEAVLVFLGLVISVTLFIAGFAGASGKWESEDRAQYERFNPRHKPVREVLRKEPTALQTKDSVVSVGKETEKGPVSDDLGKTKLVRSVMVKKVLFCSENQSADEALRIMREHDVPYLFVLNNNLMVVGTVWMRDLMPPGDEQKDPNPQSKG